MTIKVYRKELHNCKGCPNRATRKTIGTGYALTWLCSAKEDREIRGYIEYPSEEPEEIPDWCPLEDK
jgi:hypothetical protein